MSEFYQTPPELRNTYRHHPWLSDYLKSKLPAAIFSEIDTDLDRFGGLCAGEFMPLARQAEREKPQLIQFDSWGRRVDEIRISSAWQTLQDISAREGLVAAGYRRAYGEHSRLYQFAKLYLFHPSSAFFTCPLAMADGAARVLELHGRGPIHKDAFAHLTSTDPAQFWTSGQWMTEKTGGSDVGDTSTEVRFDGDQARLYGVKWFSSATTSAVALALARLPGAPAGSRGLTLFQVPTYLAPGNLNGIKILRLKDKLGTWALPTAELSLEGAKAFQVGDRDQGVKTVATMLNITRLYNSVCSIGQMTRGLDLLQDYSGKRKVFGKLLNEQVLHTSTFAAEKAKLLSGFLLTMELVYLLGKEECGTARPGESDLLRLLTPVCKLFTARSAIQTASEVVEGFGGAGYIEDSGIPVQLRDSQVFPIWEGATNVLSLDMLRVLQKSEALARLKADMVARLEASKIGELSASRDVLRSKLKVLDLELSKMLSAEAEVQIASSRSLAFHLAWLYSSALLLSWAEASQGAMRLHLGQWLAYVLTCIPEWKTKTAQELSAAQSMWSGSLGS